MDGYVDDLRIEDVAQLLANEVVDRLLLELARDRLLHTVDQREFGVPLARLVDEPSVLEGDAEAAGERHQQALVGVGEHMLAVDVLQRDDARSLPARDERDEEGGLRHFAD